LRKEPGSRPSRDRRRPARSVFCGERPPSEEGGYRLKHGKLGRSSAAPLQGNKKRCLALGEGEDEEIALAGGDDGEEAAVWGDGKVAEGEAVEDG